MKKKLTLICAAMFAFGFTALHAQQVGDDYTSAITNPGFEDSFALNQSRSKGTAESGQGWNYDFDVSGWSNFQTLEGIPCEGSLFLDNWAANVNSMDVYQTVTGLPSGYYQLSACLRIITSASDITDQHVYAEINGTTYDSPIMSEAAFGAAIENWEKLTTALIPVSSESDEIRIGIRSTGTGNGPTGWFQADDFQLIYVGSLDDSDIEKQFALVELDKVNDEAQVYALSPEMMEFEGLQRELNYDVEEIYMAIQTNDDATVEEIKAATISIKELIAKAKAGVVLYSKLESLFTACNELIQTGWPGENDFTEAIIVAQDLIDGYEKATYADYEKGIADLKAARTAYYWSQKPSPDKRADYTFLVQGPSFYNPECGLTYDEMNVDNRTIWQDIEKWIIGSNPISGNEYRTNYIGGKPCWNSWHDNFVSMDIHQVLSGLPNGQYVVECSAQTQTDLITDQHAYASSLAGTVVSKVMTIDNGWETPEGWETLTTEKISVVDGNLTIGFASTSGGGTKGWFCVTDFKLYYYGNDGSSLQSIFTARVNEATEYEVYLKGDRKALEGALAIAGKASTDAEMLAALDTINGGIAVAEASNAQYKIFVEGSLATAETKAASLIGDAQAIMSAIVDQTKEYCATNNATYEKLNTLYVPALTYYASYADAVILTQAAIEAPEEGYFEITITDLQTIMQNQKDLMIEQLVSKETTDWFIENLNNGMNAIHAGKYIREAKEGGPYYDISGIIVNGDAAAKDGWTWLNLADGPIKSGQYYEPEEITFDDNGLPSGEINTHSYFDSWNSASGALKLTAYQKLFLPNGNYTLKVAARSSCENGGAMLFVSTQDIADNDTLWQSIACNWDKGGNIYETAVENERTSNRAYANKSTGWGWSWYEFTFDVKDHKASIGMSTDSLITHKPFTGTWFSVVDFKLTINSWSDDNGDDFSWVTGMDIPITDDLVPMVIKTNNKIISVTNAVTGEAVKNYKVFTVTGTEVNPVVQQSTGIYVVKAGQQVEKVLVK